ncbi:MAG: glycoside hydrolase family 20 zincin-like fold domain-containing protein, partial [Phycisphaerae bacterium]
MDGLAATGSLRADRAVERLWQPTDRLSGGSPGRAVREAARSAGRSRAIAADGSPLRSQTLRPADWAVYPRPRRLQWAPGRFELRRARLVVGSGVPDGQGLADLYCQQLGIVAAARGPAVELHRQAMPAEHYRLRVRPRRVQVWAADRRGFVWALQTLLGLRDAAGRAGALACADVVDGPASRLRGVHIYLPSRENLDFCKRFIDQVVLRAKLNTIFLELGGGMQFKRHPEINDG